MDNNALNYDLVKRTDEFFRLDNLQMDEIIKEVLAVVATLQDVADEIGILKKK